MKQKTSTISQSLKSSPIFSNYTYNLHVLNQTLNKINASETNHLENFELLIICSWGTKMKGEKIIVCINQYNDTINWIFEIIS